MYFRRMRTGAFALLLVLLGLLFLAHLAVGSVRVPLGEVFAGLSAPQDAHALIVGGVRLPQALTAIAGQCWPCDQQAAHADALPQSAGRSFGAGHRLRRPDWPWRW